MTSQTQQGLKKRKRSVVRIGAQLVLFAALSGYIVSLFLPAIRSGPASPRSQCKNNLKQFGLALHNYHDRFRSFPPAIVRDDAGRAIHSWRTALLPDLEQGPLFESYRWHEPWNGPNNQKLLTSNIEVFACPQPPIDQKTPNTSYLAVIGPNTAWRPDGATVRLSDITDDHSMTILLVEVQATGIHIFEPRDLSIDQMPLTINSRHGQGISSRHHSGGANVLMADGTVQWLTNDLAADVLHAMLTINGGEKILTDENGHFRLVPRSAIVSEGQSR